MKRVEKMSARADANKQGKLDKNQVEYFPQELMKGGA
jgi:hypothetical protein